MRKKNICLGVGLCFLAAGVACLNAQTEPKKWDLQGYVSNMQSAMFQDVDSIWQTENLIHNRLNFHWYPSQNITATVQLRNRFIYGDFVKYFPGYKGMIANDKGFFDFTGNLLEGRSYILNSSVDRVWVRVTQASFEATLGRQRINWGQTFVWNPNDIFNTYSFFDVDYPERPGSDAIRLQYYTGFTSSVELAAKMNHNDKATIAGLWRFNKWSYDFQLLGGIMNEDDYIAGVGWSGYIKNASFRGEATYAHPMKEPGDTSGVFVVALSADYTFGNSFSLQAEALYNQLPDNTFTNGFEGFYYQDLSAKRLSFTEFNYFLQASYPVTPLLQASLSGIYYPGIKGYYVGPNLTYSLSQDVESSLILQSFSGAFEIFSPGQQQIIEQRQDFVMAYLRVKWSF
jgi:hypothetical protein